MHTLTGAIEQHSEAIRRRLDDSVEHLHRRIDHATRRLILRMMIFVSAAVAVAFVASTLN
jgi:hypothetical protein